MRIIIIGGGIGGLSLASGLRRRNFDVAVYDRDTDVAATGGYHITLDGRAQAALRELIAPAIYERLLASASALRLREPDAFWDRHGRLIGRGPNLGADPSVDVDRVTLRLLLAEAAGDALHLGQPCIGVGQSADGAPWATMADGTTITADLLVGADGPHSIVAHHLAGRATNHPAGLIGFSGRTSATTLSADERRRLGPRSSLAVGPGGAALYVGFLDPIGCAVLDAPALRMAITTGPTYIWGAMFPESARTDALRDLHGDALRDGLLAMFSRHKWNADALEVIARTDPRSVAAYRFNAASTKPQDLAPWPTSSITALGDAVHATPPTAGMGAGAAIRDAFSLVERLLEAHDQKTTVKVAISAFEADMRLRGSEVLTLAMKTVDRILATNTPLTAAALPILAIGQHMSGAFFDTHAVPMSESAEREYAELRAHAADRRSVAKNRLRDNQP